MDTADIQEAGSAFAAEADASAVRGQPQDTVVLLRQLAELTVGNARPDHEQIQAILKEAEARATQAQKVTAQLRRQLQLTSADSKRIRSELSGKRADVARLERELVLQAQIGDSRESTLRGELLEARYQALTALDSTVHDRKIWLSVTLAVAATTILCATAGYWWNNNPADKLPSRPSPVVSGAATGQSGPVYRNTPNYIDNAVSRLDDALSRLRGGSPEAILGRVRAENAARGVQVCSFEWNRGQPSLLFSGAGDRDINSAITDCADAVNRSAR